VPEESPRSCAGDPSFHSPFVPQEPAARRYETAG